MQNIFGFDAGSDFGIGDKLHSFLSHYFYPTVNHPFFQLEIRNPVAQQAADFVVLFKEGYFMTCLVKLVSSRKTCRTRAYYRQDRKSTRLNSSHVKISYAVL